MHKTTPLASTKSCQILDSRPDKACGPQTYAASILIQSPARDMAGNRNSSVERSISLVCLDYMLNWEDASELWIAEVRVRPRDVRHFVPYLT